MKNKRILVYGMGKTGLSVVDAMNDDNTLYIYDDDPSHLSLVSEDIPVYEGQEVDFVVKSPSIPMDSGLLPELLEKDIPIISDIELAYHISECENFIAISGTNGKTTVTDLLYHLLIDGGKVAYVGGNIGIGILPIAKRAAKDDCLVIECSSFQLETVVDFKPKFAILTNITEDHLDHHKSIEAYRESKKNVYKNQDDDDFLILNIDDPYLALIGEGLERALVVSTTPIQQDGAFKDQDKLYLAYNGEVIYLMDRDDMLLVGEHNVRNALEASLCAYLLGVEIASIRKTLTTYRGKRHRMEFVISRDGIDVYNDSKGTNPGSTEVALSSFSRPVRLIAGGYDKGSDFSELFKKHKDGIKGLYVYGQTEALMEKEASEAGIEDIEAFTTLEEATSRAMDDAVAGDVILFSPACASWDQFKNYEERGDRFKAIVTQKWS
ncbi:MAG: UDP-N-acetylmuramoyl-L-alanine--D-glutamate ligase [Peptoniphilus sp.]|nr:UDP-N-acetylmuramoyl-L-alanine--D-glutamate ligase [Peptoniphilus sp.]MDD7363133.1 UDP-N-acetylmuramoyl-L-alanine--D-glutamate ligase [Bacillota bacterium]MDY6044345.1 UDP-N-acetylmuramoyl-L-alanine--D-glutamate ligase [Peptoniphilus sp.]